jgi:hypothetical protein
MTSSRVPVDVSVSSNYKLRDNLSGVRYTNSYTKWHDKTLQNSIQNQTEARIPLIPSLSHPLNRPRSCRIRTQVSQTSMGTQRAENSSAWAPLWVSNGVR